MSKTRAIQTTAMILVLAVAMTFSLQRAARANDTTALIGAVIVGALVYEALDDDGPKYRGPKYTTHKRYKAPNRYERAWSPRYYGYDGYATPFPGRYDGYRQDGRYNGPPYRNGHYKNGRSGVSVGVHTGPRGPSVDLRYRDRKW